MQGFFSRKPGNDLKRCVFPTRRHPYFTCGLSLSQEWIAHRPALNFFRSSSAFQADFQSRVFDTARSMPLLSGQAGSEDWGKIGVSLPPCHQCQLWFICELQRAQSFICIVQDFCKQGSQVRSRGKYNRTSFQKKPQKYPTAFTQMINTCAVIFQFLFYSFS